MARIEPLLFRAVVVNGHRAFALSQGLFERFLDSFAGFFADDEAVDYQIDRVYLVAVEPHSGSDFADFVVNAYVDTLSFDNYRFDNRWSIAKVDGRIEPVALEGKRKSKLATTQFGLPIGLTFTPARRLRVSALAFGELVVNAHTKTKKPKQKKTLTGLNDFRFGLQGAVTYREVGFYVKYSLTPMFRSGTGPKCYPLSVGLAWGF